jgi:muramoyltetrapeptide carboxypeptidase
MRIPPALHPGDRLAVVAPASPFDRAQFERGIEELRMLGFEPVFDDSIFARTGFVAGPPAQRAAGIVRAWRDPGVAGLVAVRGGYGSVHLLPLLDAADAHEHPKVLLGYSDLTTLQIWLTQRAGVVAFQGPMIEGRFARGADGYDRDALLRVIGRAEPAGEVAPGALVAFRPGEAAGPVFGGTLTQLAASLGGPWAFAPPPGHVLFLEDVSERPYRLDRLITQLRHARILDAAAAVVLGTFPDCDEPGGAFTARDVLAQLFSDFDGPVVYGLPVGHVQGPAMTLPLGVRVRVIAGQSEARVIVEEAAVC